MLIPAPSKEAIHNIALIKSELETVYSSIKPIIETFDRQQLVTAYLSLKSKFTRSIPAEFSVPGLRSRFFVKATDRGSILLIGKIGDDRATRIIARHKEGKLYSLWEDS